MCAVLTIFLAATFYLPIKLQSLSFPLLLRKLQLRLAPTVQVQGGLVRHLKMLGSGSAKQNNNLTTATAMLFSPCDLSAACEP